MRPDRPDLPQGFRPPYGTIDGPVIDALDATGLAWWATNGKKHMKVYLAGRLVVVIAHGNSKREYQRGLTPKTVKVIRRLAAAILAGEA